MPCPACSSVDSVAPPPPGLHRMVLVAGDTGGVGAFVTGGTADNGELVTTGGNELVCGGVTMLLVTTTELQVTGSSHSEMFKSSSSAGAPAPRRPAARAAPRAPAKKEVAAPL